MNRTTGSLSGTSAYHCVPYSPCVPGSLLGREALGEVFDVTLVAVALVVAGHQLVGESAAQFAGDHSAELLLDAGLVAEVPESQIQLRFKIRDDVEHLLGSGADPNVALGGEVHGATRGRLGRGRRG